MSRTKLKMAAAALLAVSVIAGGAGVVTRPLPAQEKPSDSAEAKPAGAKEGLSLAEFDGLQKVLSLKNQPWAAIPWKNTLPEARAQAAKEKKPIFMVVNTGNCLGFV